MGVLERKLVAPHRIVRSTDGGPIRLVLGRGTTHRTGTFVAVKADYRAMPWESHKCELGVLQMCEVAAGVISLMAQPHRLELSLRGRKSKLRYFPDLELRVDRTFLDDLLEGKRFADIVARPRFNCTSSEETYSVIVEVKHESDSRLEDKEYSRKLELAGEFYRSRGMLFVVIIRQRDFSAPLIRRFETLTLDRHTKLTTDDYVDLRMIFARRRGPRSYGQVVAGLGGGPLGVAKAAAFQINRKLSIDLRRPLTDASKVYLVE